MEFERVRQVALLLAIVTIVIFAVSYSYASKEIYNAFYECDKCELREKSFKKLMLFNDLKCEKLEEKDDEK